MNKKEVSKFPNAPKYGKIEGNISWVAHFCFILIFEFKILDNS